MKKYVKTLCAALSLSLGLSGANFAAAAEGTDEYALAYFGSEDTFENMTIPGYVTDTIDVGGRMARTTKIANASHHLYCDVNDEFMYAIPNGTPVEITVEYYDSGTGMFTLDYDSYDSNAGGYANMGCAEIVNLTDTQEWKTHTFHLEDMRMMNGMSMKTDFRVGTWGIMMGNSTSDVTFGSRLNTPIICISQTHGSIPTA